MELKPGGAGIIGQRCQPGRTPGLGRTGAKSSRTQNCPTAAEGSLALRWQWPGAVMAGPRELARQLQDPEVEEVAQGLQNLGPESTSLFFFFPFRPPHGICSSWARDLILVAVVTCTTALAVLDSLTHCRDAVNPFAPQQEILKYMYG